MEEARWGDVGATSARELTHRVLWTTALHIAEERGDLFSVLWVPSHIAIFGNEQADHLAKECK